MENLITALFDLVLFLGYGLIGSALFMLIQLISYRVFKFNLYKALKYVLVERELNK